MTDDYRFAVLGATSRFEPYLSNECRKYAKLWHPSEQELPLSDPGVSAAFLSVYKPNAVFYAPKEHTGKTKFNYSILPALSHGLNTSEGLLVTWLNHNDPAPEFIDCKALIIRLPEVFYCSGQKNFITEWIDLLLTKKRLTYKESGPVQLIGRHLLMLMTVHAALRCLANPRLCGIYTLAATGIPQRREVIEFMHSTLARLLPHKEIAKISFTGNVPHLSTEIKDDNTIFMENFGVILPHWQNGVEETIVAYLCARRLF